MSKDLWEKEEERENLYRKMQAEIKRRTLKGLHPSLATQPFPDGAGWAWFKGESASPAKTEEEMEIAKKRTQLLKRPLDFPEVKSLSANIDRKLHSISNAGNKAAYTGVVNQVLSGFESLVQSSVNMRTGEHALKGTHVTTLALSDIEIRINCSPIEGVTRSILMELENSISKHLLGIYQGMLPETKKIFHTDGFFLDFVIKEIKIGDAHPSVDDPLGSLKTVKCIISPVCYLAQRPSSKEAYEIDKHLLKICIEKARKLKVGGATDFFKIDKRFLKSKNTLIGSSKSIKVRENILICI